MIEYMCDICNYKTDRLFSYNRHIKSKRHKTTIAQFDLQKNEDKMKINEDNCTEIGNYRKCHYCNKNFSKKNIRRHQNNCKNNNKKDKLLNDANSKIDELLKEMKDFKIAYEREKEMKEEYKDELVKTNKDLLKTNRALVDLATKFSDKDAVTINQYNMYYIMNNFDDAYNIEDVMNKPLTDEEKQTIRDSGALGGCYKLIEDRCINDIDLPRRPFHCLDNSRNKYLLKSNNSWEVDNMGDQILNNAYPIVRPLYKINEDDDFKDKIKNAEQLTKLENGRKRIIKELNNVSLLKNNIEKSKNKKNEE